MRARHLNLMRFDLPKAGFLLSISVSNAATATAVACGTDRTALAFGVFFLTATAAGFFAAWGIGFAVRASFGLDVPEEEGPLQ